MSLNLSYIAAQLRIKLSGRAEDFCASAEVLDAQVSRAQAKFEQLKEKGDIAAYTLYTNTLATFVETLADSLVSSSDPRATFSLVLAQASPDLSRWIVVEKTANERAIAKFSAELPPAEAKNFRVQWLEHFLDHSVSRWTPSGVKAHRGQVHSLCLRLRQGGRIKNELLAAEPRDIALGSVSERPLSVVLNSKRGEIYLIIKDYQGFIEGGWEQKWPEYVASLSHKVAGHSETGFDFRTADFATDLAALAGSPESFGIGLPLSFLVAVPKMEAAKDLGREEGEPEAISFVVSEDRMTARIASLDDQLHAQGTRLDQAWLERQLRRARLSPDLARNHMGKVLASLGSRRDVVGTILVEGRASVGASKPYLHPCFREELAAQRQKQLAAVGDGKVDLRAHGSLLIVGVGDLVAEVRHYVPGVAGQDVYGEPLPEATPAALTVKLGEGVEQRTDGKYYATQGGVPVVGSDQVSVTRVLIVHGDVNLRSGNIDFEGTVEIHGSVDPGTTVRCGGDMLVVGGILGGSITVAGNLTVRQGITMVSGGRLHCDGSVAAQFIENSSLSVSGDIDADRAILGANLFCGGEVRVADRSAGIIAGGRVMARRGLHTANLGFQRGAATEVRLGGDWKRELIMTQRKAKLSRWEAVYETCRNDLREIIGRRTPLLGKKRQERKQELEVQVQRLRQITTALGKRLKEASENLTYDSSAAAFIHETCTANCRIYVGGKQIALVRDMAGIAILGRRHRGSYIVPVRDGIKLRSRNPGPRAGSDLSDDEPS